MADISTTNKKARVPILGENGRISDAYIPQAVIDAEASSKTYAENAKSYSELAKKDAEIAASSAASAKESADAAREGISSIDEKVTQAGQFAEAASSSAAEANSYLEQVKEVSNTVSGIASNVAENAKTAETFANESKESAASALTASTGAVNAKVDAEGYRDSAKSYSDNAKVDADTSKNILESVKTQKTDVDSTVQQFKTDATKYDTKFSGYVSEAKESKEASAASAASASESAENASTSASNASTSETNAKTSADAAALSATNAATSAKEAADNLPLLGASTLTRKEKDTFIHVNDAFPTSLFGIEIEGACKQDGTPSPENPVPIQVIEHPVVKVVGRNLLDIAALANDRPVYYKVDGDTLTILKSDNGAWASIAITQELKAGTYILSGDNVEIRNVDNNVLSFAMNGVGSPFTLAADTEIKIKIGYGMGSKYPYTTKAMIERSSSISDYAPYASQSQALTLPPEHPYLAKLPDGTADKIIIDKEGKVKLIANVKKIVWDGDASSIRAEDSGLTYKRFVHRSKDAVKGGNNVGLLDRLTVGNSFAYDLQANASGNNTGELYSNYQAAKNSIDKYVEWLKGDVTGYMPTLESKEYDLGRIDLLAIPESVGNIWVDAEVTPNVAIEYVRDANIVVSNLEQAIASITQG